MEHKSSTALGACPYQLIDSPVPALQPFSAPSHEAKLPDDIPQQIIITINGVRSIDLDRPKSVDTDIRSYRYSSPGTFHCSGSYYGSGSRIGDHATVWNLNAGYHDKTLSVYFIGDKDSAANLEDLKPISTIYVSKDSWPRYLDDFTSHRIVGEDDIVWTINTRQLHRFDYDIEISGVTIDTSAVATWGSASKEAGSDI